MTLILYAVAGIILFGVNLFLELLAYTASKKELDKDDKVKKTFIPRRRKIFALILNISFFALTIGGIIIFSLEKMELVAWIALLVPCLFFDVCSILFYLSLLFNYEEITETGIVVHRLFKKKKCYNYSDILYYKNCITLDVFGRNFKILFVLDGRIGEKSIINALESHGIFNYD